MSTALLTFRASRSPSALERDATHSPADEKNREAGNGHTTSYSLPLCQTRLYSELPHEKFSMGVRLIATRDCDSTAHRSIGRENANDAGEVACDKPEAKRRALNDMYFRTPIAWLELVNPGDVGVRHRPRNADVRSCGPVLNLRFSGKGFLVARIIHDESSRGSGSRGR